MLDADVRLAGGSRSGQILLALPADGRGRAPRPMPEATPAPVAQAQFTKALTDQVMVTEAELAAVLHRVTMPLSPVMGLEPGAIAAAADGRAGPDRAARGWTGGNWRAASWARTAVCARCGCSPNRWPTRRLRPSRRC